ncbi:MAG: type II toxin-antitoxin system death-on-curing family toxin [Pseudomonadota bacterium]|nr:type II toxin-antitoxin system death-on-curing family toxin [Pseudomonadota bacterium]
MSWRWLRPETAEAIHLEQLAEHGGGAGVRALGALLSALARPENLAVYGEPDAAALAAAYAFGVAKNHPFIDGNKRTAWVLARLFLSKNGVSMDYKEAEAVVVMLRLAAGELSEDELANWFRERNELA